MPLIENLNDHNRYFSSDRRSLECISGSAIDPSSLAFNRENILDLSLTGRVTTDLVETTLCYFFFTCGKQNIPLRREKCPAHQPDKRERPPPRRRWDRKHNHQTRKALPKEDRTEKTPTGKETPPPEQDRTENTPTGQEIKTEPIPRLSTKSSHKGLIELSRVLRDRLGDFFAFLLKMLPCDMKGRPIEDRVVNSP